MDAPAPAPQPSEKLLIDLSNTPDLTKTSSAKPWGGQVRGKCYINKHYRLNVWSWEDFDVFERSFLCSPKLHLFHQNYSKNNNIAF